MTLNEQALIEGFELFLNQIVEELGIEEINIDAAMEAFAEEMQLDELSRKTLGSYVKKASQDNTWKAVDYGHHLGQTGGKKEKENTDRISKIINRNKGIERASNKLAKEETVVEDAEDFDAGVDVENPGTSKEIKKKLMGKDASHDTKGMTDEKPEVPGDSAAIEKCEQNEAAAIVDAALTDKPSKVGESFEEILHGILQQKIAARKEELQNSFLGVQEEGLKNLGDKMLARREKELKDKSYKKPDYFTKKSEKPVEEESVEESRSFRRAPGEEDTGEQKKVSKAFRQVRKTKNTIEEPKEVDEARSFRRAPGEEDTKDLKKVSKAFRQVRQTKKTVEEPKEVDEEHLDEKNWIAGAVEHPGKETRLAKKAGETTHEYMEKHKNSPGAAGKRARLGLTLSKIAKEEVEQIDELSRKTLRSYDKKATADLKSARKAGDHDRIGKREKGLASARKDVTLGEATFKLNPKKIGMWKGKTLSDVEKAKTAAKKSGNVTREREAQFAINAKEGKFKKGA